MIAYMDVDDVFAIDIMIFCYEDTRYRQNVSNVMRHEESGAISLADFKMHALSVTKVLVAQ